MGSENWKGDGAREWAREELWLEAQLSLVHGRTSSHLWRKGRTLLASPKAGWRVARVSLTGNDHTSVVSCLLSLRLNGQISEMYCV